MTDITRKVIRWALSGAAFLAVVTSASCSSHDGAQSSRNLTADEDARERQLPGDVEGLASPDVNVLGEMGGSRKTVDPSANIGAMQQHTAAAQGADVDVSVDATGTQLAFSSTRVGKHAEIFLARADGSSIRQLTHDGAEAAFPQFSRDSKCVAFCSTRAGNWDL